MFDHLNMGFIYTVMSGWPWIAPIGACAVSVWSLFRSVVTLRARARARRALQHLDPTVRAQIQTLLRSALKSDVLDRAAVQLNSYLTALSQVDRDRLHVILYQPNLVGRRSCMLELLSA